MEPAGRVPTNGATNGHHAQVIATAVEADAEAGRAQAQEYIKKVEGERKGNGALASAGAPLCAMEVLAPPGAADEISPSPLSNLLPGRLRCPAMNHTMALNVTLCVLLLTQGCLEPMFVDFSRTTIEYRPGEKEGRRTYPYDVMWVLMFVRLIDMIIAMIGIVATNAPGGLRSLLSWKMHVEILPQSVVYAFADAAVFFSIGCSDGPLYMAIYNTRVIIIAMMSKLILGRKQTNCQWAWLVGLSITAAWYGIADAESGSSPDQRAAQRVLPTACWALTKAMMSGTGAVLTELNYKSLNLWEASGITQGQGLLVLLSFKGIQRLLADPVPACSDDVISQPCVGAWSWDGWTWAVIVVYVAGGWLGAFTVKRMSAMARVISKTAVCPSLYTIYALCVPTFRTSLSGSAAIATLTISIFGYALGRVMSKPPAQARDRPATLLQQPEQECADKEKAQDAKNQSQTVSV